MERVGGPPRSLSPSFHTHILTTPVREYINETEYHCSQGWPRMTSCFPVPSLLTKKWWSKRCPPQINGISRQHPTRGTAPPLMPLSDQHDPSTSKARFVWRYRSSAIKLSSEPVSIMKTTCRPAIEPSK